MNIEKNEIGTEFDVFNSDQIKIICVDNNKTESIGITYFINIINDLDPYITINHPTNDLKLNETHLINLIAEIYDDFGI